MISYNPKDWLRFLFKFHKGDTLRQLLVFMIIISAYSAIIAYLELEYWKLSKASYISNLSLLHQLLGFVLSLLLVFRTNTAYDRWWEGRKLWGSLVNNSRNLAIKLNALLRFDDHTERKFFSRMIPLYASILRDHLSLETTRLALDNEEHPELAAFDKNKHAPNQVASLITQRIYKLYHDKKITGDELITLNSEVQSFTDICGACERIKNTPIPFSYSTFVKKFIVTYVITLPFGFVFSLGYWVVPVVAFIFYVLASLEVIAEEIEDPFGVDQNDLPTAKIADNIKKHVTEILH
jgi:ion channel-forming bestrophin family protein